MTERHELLNRPWVWKLSFDEAVERQGPETDRKYRNTVTLNQRIDHFRSKLDLVIWHHLGLGDVPDIERHVDHGVDLAIDYFWSDWWTAEGLDRLMPLELEQELGFDRPGDARDNFLNGNACAVNKQHPERSLKWLVPLQAGLLLGGLAGRWADVAKVCSWFDPTIEPEYSAGIVEEQLFLWYVGVACQLKPEPDDDVGTLFERVRAARRKRPRLLMAAWEAVMSIDQDAFDQAFPASVKHFVSSADKKTKIAREWVALDQSIVWLVAEQRGLRLPALSPKCAAAVITRQSISTAS